MSIFNFNRTPEGVIDAAHAEWLDMERDIHPLIPQRIRLNPANLKGALPFVCIFNVLGKGEFAVRLAGTGMCDIYGVDATGMDVDSVHEMYDWSVHYDAAIYAPITELPCGMTVTREISSDKYQYPWTMKTLSLPMCDSEGHVAYVFFVVEMYPSESCEITRGWPRMADITQATLVEMNYMDIGAGVPK